MTAAAAQAKPSGDRAATRSRILEEARVIATERGYRGTTLAMIQKAAGVHPGSMYWFFKDKDALFTALIEHAHQEASASYAGTALLEHPNPVAEALSRIVDNPARFGLWRFNVQLMLDPAMHDSGTAEAIRALRVATKESIVRQWLAGLDAAVTEAFPDLARELAEYSLATVEGCALARVAGQPLDEQNVTALATGTMDTLVAHACAAVNAPLPAGVAERRATADSMTNP